MEPCIGKSDQPKKRAESDRRSKWIGRGWGGLCFQTTALLEKKRNIRKRFLCGLLSIYSKGQEVRRPYNQREEEDWYMIGAGNVENETNPTKERKKEGMRSKSIVRF